MLGSTTFDERSSCPSLLGCDDDSSDLSNGSYQRASHQFRLEFSGGDDDLDLCILMYLHSLTFLRRPREYTYKIGNFSMKSNYYIRSSCIPRCVRGCTKSPATRKVCFEADLGSLCLQFMSWLTYCMRVVQLKRQSLHNYSFSKTCHLLILTKKKIFQKAWFVP